MVLVFDAGMVLIHGSVPREFMLASLPSHSHTTRRHDPYLASFPFSRDNQDLEWRGVWPLPEQKLGLLESESQAPVRNPQAGEQQPTVGGYFLQRCNATQFPQNALLSLLDQAAGDRLYEADLGTVQKDLKSNRPHSQREGGSLVTSPGVHL